MESPIIVSATYRLAPESVQRPTNTEIEIGDSPQSKAARRRISNEHRSEDKSRRRPSNQIRDPRPGRHLVNRSGFENTRHRFPPKRESFNTRDPPRRVRRTIRDQRFVIRVASGRVLIIQRDLRRSRSSRSASVGSRPGKREVSLFRVAAGRAD